MGKQGVPRGSTYRISDNWIDEEAASIRKNRAACESHLIDLLQHSNPIATVKIREGVPQSYKRVVLP